MHFSNPSRIALLNALLLAQHVSSAPIPMPMLTHVDGATTIWVTSHNTLNATAPLSGRSIGRRQGHGGWGGFPGGSWGPPGSGGPPGGTQWGPPGGGQWGPPGGWTGNTDTAAPAPAPTTSAAPPPPPTSSPTEAPTTAPASSPTPFPTSSLSPPPPPPSSTASPSTSSATAPASVPPPASTSASSPASTSVSPTSTVAPASSSPTEAPTSSAAPSTESTQSSQPPAPTSTGTPPSTGNTLQLSLINSLSSNDVHAYVTGLDSNGQVVMLTTDGSYYNVPSPGTTTPQKIDANIAIPLNGPGETTTLTLPDYISSARVWFADGELQFHVVDTEYGPGLVEPTAMNPNDPSADVNWGFVELTFKSGYGLFANLSYVDFVGLPLGISLQTASSGTQQALGMPGDGVQKVCELLKGQAGSDGEKWDELCTNDPSGNLIRVVAPPTVISQDTNAFANYFNDYIDMVWQSFAGETLTINTQSSSGDIACTSDGNTLTCAGSSQSYGKPSSEDIFGCNSGPFAISESDNDIHAMIVPRLCAAINRATLHLPGGNVQPALPPSDYYTAHPNNWYSAFVHQIESEGKGYAFSYDDVSPTEEDNTSGSVFAPDPTVLTVYVGGASAA